MHRKWIGWGRLLWVVALMYIIALWFNDNVNVGALSTPFMARRSLLRLAAPRRITEFRNATPLRSSVSDSTTSSPSSKLGADAVAEPSISTGTTQQQTQKQPPAFVTPYHLLNPTSFPLIDGSRGNGYDRILSLHSVLRLFRQCLTQIAANKNETLAVLKQAISTSINKKKIIRIEHLIGAVYDPLSWLRAQYNNVDASEAMLYMCTQEKDTEVACIGSAVQLKDTEEIWSTYDNTTLPANSQWYGGERFDAETEPSDEWQAFGRAYWILPAVELLVRRSTTTLAQQHGTTSRSVTTLAVHLVANGDEEEDWLVAAKKLLDHLQPLSARLAAAVPPTTLPPILSRDNSKANSGRDGQEMYEEAVAQALDELNEEADSTAVSQAFKNDTTDQSNKPAPSKQQHQQTRRLEKVVLARQQNLHFGAAFTSLDVIRRWKYGGHEGGHLFWLRPSKIADDDDDDDGQQAMREFFGCTPERLFQVKADSRTVTSEALAGTRPRGSTQEADDALLRDLFASPKDLRENRLTGQYIEAAFDELCELGLVTNWNEDDHKEIPGDNGEATSSGFFVRRLLHLQHICQRYSAEIVDMDKAMEVTRRLMTMLHPTPAVCGVPMRDALDFIRKYESIGVDRGFYSGPFGYIGSRGSDIVVAIRSGLATTTAPSRTTTVSSYAGAGIVAGSTLQGEWAETSYKFAVISSMFPQSPMTLRGAATPNVAWATAFVAELIRNGITRFYICPGSRSTPLVTAIAKAMRLNVGVVHAVSVHDERAAGFRALGYARGSGKPAAVLTSSGTAVANLYPAVVEASMDGVPMLLLTADRPYESRATGANQAIDQVKMFSDAYIRWFRDILPPSDDVPVSLALSDAGHGIHLARLLRGPVHINIQFRENLAPDAGPIRNDSRMGSITKFNGIRFTDVPGFDRWSKRGNKWSTSYVFSSMVISSDAVRDVASFIETSKRGIIVVGNLRTSTDEGEKGDQAAIVQAISDFAKLVGFPIFAGAQSASLRFVSSAVVPFAEHMLKCRAVADNLKPDLIIQIGAPLVSTAIPGILAYATKDSDKPALHVLLHPYVPQERSDPSLTVTHAISAEIAPFINRVSDLLTSKGVLSKCSSQLAPLILLGRMLQSTMKSIIFEASEAALHGDESNTTLTEPQIVVALSEVFSTSGEDRSLFLSNSMPIRDAEFFLYPMSATSFDGSYHGPTSIGTNRGASGIDGIISSALGFSESTETPTTLVIGDLATLHDIGSFHSVADSTLNQNHANNKKRNPLTTIIVNNNGGGIFSYLPIAKHGKDVAFEEFFGTPTSTFSFKKGAEAFGVAADVATDYGSFLSKYEKALELNKDSVIEARVVKRATNVEVHKKITKAVEYYVASLLLRKPVLDFPERLPVKIYNCHGTGAARPTVEKTMVLLHGWLGDKLEWDESAKLISERCSSGWKIISVDLPGHGSAPLYKSSGLQSLRSALHICVENDDNGNVFSIDRMAESVLDTLFVHHGVEKIDALAGYSAGGRVALAIKRLCASKFSNRFVATDTATFLLGAYPGQIQEILGHPLSKKLDGDEARIRKDDSLANEIVSLVDKTCLTMSYSEAKLLTDGFLRRWYGTPMWGSLTQRGLTYRHMIEKRSRHLVFRGKDLAVAMSQLSPPRNNRDDWRYCTFGRTLFIAGELDSKYTEIGKALQRIRRAQYEEIESSGHALLVEAPARVAELIVDFLNIDCSKALTKEPLTTDSMLYDLENEVVPAAILSSAKESGEAEGQIGQTPLWATTADASDTIDSVEFESFSIDLVDGDCNEKPVFGIGWGKNAEVNDSSKLSTRDGLLVQLVCTNGLEVGLGEISPLPGLHLESMDQAKREVELLQETLRNAKAESLPEFQAERILALDGSLGDLLKSLAQFAGIERFLPSVHSGLEMALISLASQKVSFPVHQALIMKATQGTKSKSQSSLPLCGLITRTSVAGLASITSSIGQNSFPSFKVKVGHQDLNQDSSAMLRGFQRVDLSKGGLEGRVRADANRAWNESQAIEFASALEGLDVHALEKIEFLEEPLSKVTNESGDWSFEMQVSALERSYFRTAIPYALDESLADLAQSYNWRFKPLSDALEAAFTGSARGCAAFVIKPALLGMELSLQIARLARTKLGIGAVFSSSFDSGLGLAHTAFLGHLADQMSSTTKTYPHGIGTYTMMGADTLTPPFGSYVNPNGILNIPSLSRALYGLSLEEMRDSFNSDALRVPKPSRKDRGSLLGEETFEASTATSSCGKEISVVVSLPLPFSAETACSRFTDLPSMSRWSPWISSVRYQGTETEWTINVRGIPLKWRATSQLVEDPFPGIQWQSVSGLNNRGIVEFVADELSTDPANSCTMNVRMTIVTPRLLRPLFQGTSLFLEDFLRDKLLKWSLEMFRDVVKADLALERYV